MTKKLINLAATFVWLFALISPCSSAPLPAKPPPHAAQTHIQPAPSAPSSLEQNGPVKDKWALVIGISQFQNPQLNLKYAAKDATDFYNYLITDGGFARDHVKLLTNENATHNRILSELGGKWLPRVAGPDDLVVIFISSHGSAADYDVDGDNFIVTYDTTPTDLYTTALDMQELTKIIKHRVHSRRVAIFLDACHSGSITPEAKGLTRSPHIDASRIALGTGQLVVCSSQPDQVSWESKSTPNGVFTKYLLDGLQLKDKSTTLGEAFDFMSDKVQRTVLRERGELQTPVLRSQWKGQDLILAVKPANPAPGLADEENPSTAEVTPTYSKPSPPVLSRTTTPPPDSQPIPPVRTSPPVVTYVQPRPPIVTTPQPVQLDDQILLLPISRARKETVVPVVSGKDLWGVVSSPAEYAALPAVLTSQLQKLIQKRTGLPVIAGRYSPAMDVNSFKQVAAQTKCKYILQVAIDSVEWRPGMMSNKYKMEAYAILYSGENGTVIKSIPLFEIKKSPFSGDRKGGRQYFEEDVTPEAASNIADELAHQLGR